MFTVMLWAASIDASLSILATHQFVINFLFCDSYTVPIKLTIFLSLKNLWTTYVPKFGLFKYLFVLDLHALTEDEQSDMQVDSDFSPWYWVV